MVISCVGESLPTTLSKVVCTPPRLSNGSSLLGLWHSLFPRSMKAHSLHATGQLSSMYPLFFPHSPLFAQTPQFESRSRHLKVSNRDFLKLGEFIDPNSLTLGFTASGE